MFQNLSLRAKLIAIAVPPLVVLACVAFYGLLLSLNGAQENLDGDIRTLSIIALAGLILTTLIGVMVFRTVVDPVDEITAATRDLADNRLPQLVEALRTNDASQPEFPPITFEQGDELGDLAAALNDVQKTATNVAFEQQILIRKGVSEIVINMARRNQTLLDRQIEYIDGLESAEEDPDRLEQLFGLDHLATRMRRNAESLLVLAGAESARRRGGPVAVGDVLRVAMSEIEDYRHVQLHGVEDSDIAAASAVDLAHLLSELMENSTQFSPPDAPVEVSGTTHPDGSYLISIVDHGIGMNEEQLAAANSTIANPPELGLNLSRSLGFIVVGRLAQRLAVRIELVHSSGGGVTAIIEVPQAVLNGGAPVASGQPQVAPGADANGSLTAPVDMPMQANDMPAPAMPSPEMPAPAMGGPGAPIGNDPAPALDQNPFGAADIDNTSGFAPQEEAWSPPSVPERGANPIGGVPEAMPSAPAMPQAPAGESDALAKLLGSVAPQAPAMPAPPAPPAAFDAGGLDTHSAADSFDAGSFDAGSLDEGSATAIPAFDEASFDPNAYEQPTAAGAPSFDGGHPIEPVQDAAFDAAPSFEAPSFEATDSFDAAPSFEAPDSFDAAPSSFESFDDAQSFDGANFDGANSFESNSFESASFESPSFESETFDSPQPLEQVPAAPAPAKLEEAIPTGDAFDAGMDNLLEGNQSRTSSGLVKRDRSQSQAPTSEGRQIPDAGASVAASSRSPEEIRSMLARYREGLKGRPLEGIAGDAAAAGEPTQPSTENNPFGDHA